MRTPYRPPAETAVATAHVSAPHHYLALAAGGAFARSHTETGWRVTLGGQPATLLAALTASVLSARGLIAWLPVSPTGAISALTPDGDLQLRIWERALDRGAS